MVSYKTKTFNITTTANVNPGQNIETVLEAGAKILGVVLSIPTVLGADNAKFSVYAEIGGIAIPIANGDCTNSLNVYQMWAGADGQKPAAVVAAGPAVNTVNGVIPEGMRATWIDGFNSAPVTFKLQIITAGGGQVQVYYTTEAGTDSGLPI